MSTDAGSVFRRQAAAVEKFLFGLYLTITLKYPTLRSGKTRIRRVWQHGGLEEIFAVL
jgi:hypothetical protein